MPIEYVLYVSSINRGRNGVLVFSGYGRVR